MNSKKQPENRLLFVFLNFYVLKAKPNNMLAPKKSILFSWIFLTAISLHAQRRTENFEITLPDHKISSSLYNSIRFLDSRKDTVNMGIVQLGAFNTKARVVCKRRLPEQFSDLVHALTDSSAKNGELLFQLRQMSFAEVTSAMSEKGYFHLRACLYESRENRFFKLRTIDTIVLIKAMDVTKGLFRKGSKTLSDFIANNLTAVASDTGSYSYEEVIQIDSVEKSKLALYTAAGYTDGLYKNFTSFTSQTPDISELETSLDKSGNLSWIKIKNEAGKFEKIKSKTIYAVVYQGNLYIATDYGYYPLTKKDDDFYFTGKAKVDASQSDILMASMFFGIIGGLLASSPGDAVFDMKLDHVSGGFIRLKEIPQAPANQ